MMTASITTKERLDLRRLIRSEPTHAYEMYVSLLGEQKGRRMYGDDLVGVLSTAKGDDFKNLVRSISPDGMPTWWGNYHLDSLGMFLSAVSGSNLTVSYLDQDNGNGLYVCHIQHGRNRPVGPMIATDALSVIMLLTQVGGCQNPRIITEFVETFKLGSESLNVGDFGITGIPSEWVRWCMISSLVAGHVEGLS